MDYFKGDLVDFVLSPRAKFEKGRFLKGKVVHVDRRNSNLTFVTIMSKTYTERSGQYSITVNAKQCRLSNKKLAAKNREKALKKLGLINSEPNRKKKVKSKKKATTFYTEKMARM